MPCRCFIPYEAHNESNPTSNSSTYWSTLRHALVPKTAGREREGKKGGPKIDRKKERKKKRTAQMWCAYELVRICVCVSLSLVPVNCSCPRAIQPTCSPRRPPMTLPCVNQHMCLSQRWLASYLQGALQRDRCDWKKSSRGTRVRATWCPCLSMEPSWDPEHGNSRKTCMAQETTTE